MPITIRHVALARCGLVYELTGYGRELEPIVLALGRWGFRSMGEPDDDDIVTADSLSMALRTAFGPEFASVAMNFKIQVGAVELRAQVGDGAEGGPDRSPGTAGGRLAAQRRA
ncbi:MAG TPA: hypothetical protein VIW24_24890 [Aldersonia sp.]